MCRLCCTHRSHPLRYISCWGEPQTDERKIDHAFQMFVRALVFEAHESLKINDSSLGVELFDAAIALRPNDPNVFSERSRWHMSLAKIDEAITDAKKAVHIHSTLPILSCLKIYLDTSILTSYLALYGTFDELSD